MKKYKAIVVTKFYEQIIVEADTYEHAKFAAVENATGIPIPNEIHSMETEVYDIQELPT